MRVLILSSEFPPGPGGIGTHAWAIARHLTQCGWTVVVISPQDYSDPDEVFWFNSSQPFQIISIPRLRFLPRKGFYRLSVYARWVLRWQPDVVMATGQPSVWLASCLLSHHKMPWVAIGHGMEFGARCGWRHFLTRWAFQQASVVVTVSQYTWQKMLTSGIRPKKGVIIPNGADSERFKVLEEEEIIQFRTRLGLNESHVLLTVGHVTYRKGQDIVIRALPRILKEFPRTQYLLIGLPSQKDEFLHLAHDLGVARNVHFLGAVVSEALVQYINACDIFVMTSRHTGNGSFEGFGIAVVEAALCGKPAVVSANSGLVEAIAEGQTGFCVPEDDASTVAQKIVDLLRDPVQRQRMGEAARQRAIKEQSWGDLTRRYDALFQGLRGHKNH